MKRFLLLTLALVITTPLCLLLFSCGGSPSAQSDPSGESGSVEESSEESSEMEKEKVTLNVAASPEGEEMSDAYIVTVRYGKDGEPVEVPCYKAKVGLRSITTSGEGEIETREMSFCYFDSDFEKEVFVSVTPNKKESFEICEVRPISNGITPETSGNSVEFKLGSPAKLSVEFDGDIYTNLFIFAGETEKEVINDGDPGVIYYGPGSHDAGEIVLKSNQTLYLAPGALVYGYVVCENANNVAIKGRGILCGSKLDHKMNSPRQRLCSFDKCLGVTIDGVIFIDSPTWTLRTYVCKNVVINNLKEICWFYNSDGIDLCSCRNVTITDSFLRNYDDNISIKAFESADSVDILVENCVFWADCAHNMLVGPEARDAEYENKYTDIVFKSITILEQKQTGDFYKGVMAITCADNAVYDNITWDGVVIERLSDGSVINFRFSNDYATYYGKSVTNVTVKNVNCLVEPQRGDVILGMPERSFGEITIENYTVNGKKVTFEDHNFTPEVRYIDSLTIENETRTVSKILTVN